MMRSILISNKNVCPYLFISFIIITAFSCKTDDTDLGTLERSVVLETLLSEYTTVARDSVIACASGSMNMNEAIVYAYPRSDAEDMRYFETDSILVDEKNFENYRQIILEKEDIFNGYLNKFIRETIIEKWVIISFVENGILNLSSPIRLKHQTQNTIFTDDVSINQSDLGMPLFSWDSIGLPEDKIYFQVLSDTDNDLLSGTYTFDTEFKFYDL